MSKEQDMLEDQEPRQSVIGFKLKMSEREALIKYCKKHGFNMSKFIRTTVMDIVEGEK